jgi:hypothetical protein
MQYEEKEEKKTEVRKRKRLTGPLWFQSILTDPALDRVNSKFIHTYVLHFIIGSKNGRKYFVV